MTPPEMPVDPADRVFPWDEESADRPEAGLEESIEVRDEVLTGLLATKGPSQRKPKPQELKLSARQFIRARRQRWEQSAGFIAEMRNLHGADAKKVRSDWDRLWDAFWARPVK